MRRRDPRRGFEPVGSVDLRAAGVHAREARRLQLDRAWARVAGEAIGRRAFATGIRRGTLEVEIADPAWARELAPLLSRLVARLARELPDLGIRKFKTVAGGGTIHGAIALDPLEPEPTASSPTPPRARPTVPPSEHDGMSAGDLLDLATRYLERAREAGRQRG